MDEPDWPPLPYDAWEGTRDTLHLWTQIVGKTRLALSPLQNHWWNVPFYVSPRGLTTSSVPEGGHHRVFEAEFDFLSHRLEIRASDGRRAHIELFPRSVADFYQEYRDRLRELGIRVRFWPVPVEFDDPTPFPEDRHHASYDAKAVERFRQALINADLLFKRFQTGFTGKTSPVHFFWGSFDLAVTRFSGRRAPERPGADPITREAYSHEVISGGFWPGDRRFPHAAFYCYAAPVPPGLETERVPPPGAWNTALGEFLLKYEDVRDSGAPDQEVLAFLRSAYEAAARRASWDRVALERAG
ncbi:MAG TPA: DUF5996 family protein [Planctomycetota bacterium]